MIASGPYVRGSEFRITVLTPTVLDAVQFAGGWIFDRAWMGWTVCVGISVPTDDRPLRVLGATALDRDSLLDTGAESSPSALAVSAALYEQDGRVRDLVRVLLACRDSQVTMWGDSRPAELRLTDSRFA